MANTITAITEHPESVVSSSLKTLFKRERPPVKWLSIKPKGSDSSVITKQPNTIPSEVPTEITPLGLIPTNLKHHIIHEVIHEEERPPDPWLKRDIFIREVAFDLHTFDVRITCTDLLIGINPERNIFMWMVINGVLLLSTLLIPFFLWLFDSDSKVHIEIMRFYLGYTLFNCAMWLLEISLKLLYNVRGQNCSCFMVVELLLSVYFLYATMGVFLMKNRQGFLEAYDCTLDMIINFVAYLWIFIDCLFIWRTADDFTLLEEHFARQQGSEDRDQIQVVV